MAESPDQFQRRVRVRLPFADRYLGTDREVEAASRDLAESFRIPRLRIDIGKAGRSLKFVASKDRDPAPHTER